MRGYTVQVEGGHVVETVFSVQCPLTPGQSLDYLLKVCTDTVFNRAESVIKLVPLVVHSLLKLVYEAVEVVVRKQNVHRVFRSPAPGALSLSPVVGALIKAIRSILGVAAHRVDQLVVFVAFPVRNGVGNLDQYFM